MKNELIGSGIIEEALQFRYCSRKEATHFVLYNDRKIKYLIDLTRGARYILRSIAPYNIKLILLKKLFPLIPLNILRMAGIGNFAHITPHPDIQKCIPQNTNWNVLVGAYDSVQKLIFQCFHADNRDCIYIKVGNNGSAAQMENEICFLRQNKTYHTFEIPVLTASCLMKEGCTFNIQVTKEFHGQKANPILTERIYKLTNEIAGEDVMIDGRAYTFSHGDFAPWNIRENADRYIVFDWEHARLRPKYYDLLYYTIIYEIALSKCDFKTAFDKALLTAQKFNPDIRVDYSLFLSFFKQTTKTLKF